jgi:hypothetical protein
MTTQSAGRPSRQPLSMQTEYARQQQFITFVTLLLLLGPITLLVAGVVAGMTGRRHRRRTAWCALGGVLALAAAAWFWRDYYVLALLLWRRVSGAYQVMQAAQATGKSADYWQLAQSCWPPLWQWWRWSLLAAPLAALNLLNSRVQSAEELERERFERQERVAADRERHARARVDKAPAAVSGALVLGVPLQAGDLPWSTGDFFTYPRESMARHSAVIGGSGMGKSETVLRLAAGAKQVYGWKVFFVDCKGERALQERFVTTMRAAGAERVGLFPHQPLRGWQGDSVALLNRLMAVIDFSEAYYRDLTKMLLNLTLEAPGGPPRSSDELLEGMQLARLRQRYGGRPELDEIDGLRPKDAAATYNRYRAFFKALGGGLDAPVGDDSAGWSFDNMDAGYIRLDGLSLKEQTTSLGRFLIEDFAHYVSQRKPKDERVLLVIDEYPVIAWSGAATASLFEMVRFHGASIVVTGQSYAGMGEGFDRILGAAETLFLHRCGDPDHLLPRAGQRLAFKRRVGFDQRGIGQGAREFATGGGFLAVDEELKIHPNDVLALPPGECYVIAGGRYQRVLIKRAAHDTPAPQKRTSQTGVGNAPKSIAPPVRIDVIEVEHVLPDLPRATPSGNEQLSRTSEPSAAPRPMPDPASSSPASPASQTIYEDEE